MIQRLSLFFISILFVACSSDSDNDTQNDSNNTSDPTITVSDFTISLPENPSTGDIIGTVNASSSSGSLQFSISSQTPTGAVSIDNSGTLKVADASAFDYEVNQTISGTVQVSVGDVSESASFQITLEDVEEGLTFEGDIQIFTQAEVDAFGANNYNIINGWLEIKAPISGASDITDLSPLASIIHVYRLKIQQIPVTSLDGLNHLQVVENTLNINDLPNLEDISALGNLESVGQALFLTKLPALQNLHGLEQLNHVSQLLDIRENDALTNIDGLSGLTTMGPSEGVGTVDMYLLNNPLLTSIEGLSNLTGNIDKLSIGACPSLQNLNGLEGISGELVQLSLGGLSNLTSIGGLQNITHTDELNIGGCSSLTSLDELQSLSSIGSLSLVDNPLLGDIDLFCNISFNAYGITIEEMPLLEDLACFQNLTTVNYDFYLQNNANLSSLQGLESLSHVENIFFIRNNPMLTDLCALTTLSQEGNVGLFDASNNAYNPTLDDIANGDCSL